MKILYTEKECELENDSVKTFLGKSFDYWYILQNNAEQLGVDKLIERITELEYKLKKIKEIVQ